MEGLRVGNGGPGGGGGGGYGTRYLQSGGGGGGGGGGVEGRHKRDSSLDTGILGGYGRDQPLSHSWDPDQQRVGVGGGVPGLDRAWEMERTRGLQLVHR